jgi:endogenous inhibitor of DNA gyrase (YacG/DUF329 family)
LECPICKKPVDETAKAFPFCSERCRLIDLGNWLDGRSRLTRDDDPKDNEN